MKYQEYLIEAKNKPSFVQYFFSKQNYKKLHKQFEEDYYEIANEMGQDVIDSEYDQEEDGFEIDGEEAYSNYAHTMGYQAEYEAAQNVIYNNRNKYDYQRGEENDEELQQELIEYMGYSTDFGSSRRSKRKEDYWKMAEQ